VFEVKREVEGAKNLKACGFDRIPADVLKNDSSVMFLHSLFNVCFETGTIPTSWGKSIIYPIPKSSTNDARDPLSYRGISLACSMYKLYSSLLNNRLSEWSELNEIIVDEQNGFRKQKSTIDHVSTLTNIIQTRKCKKLSTFCSFIDFRKAYDSIDRNILWNKLSNNGISGRMLNAVKSLYCNVSSCVQVNNVQTGWFDVKCGLRQGCGLSPLLFNLFVNDLATAIKSLGKGVLIGEERLSILLYADDIVLLAENEKDLHSMLNVLSDWCINNGLTVNINKSNIVHFRPACITKSDYVFSYGDTIIETVDKYVYLGVLLTEHLNYDKTVKFVAKSASRALGLLIAKFKAIGCMPYVCVYTSCTIH
jgi:hypothetical protein